MHRFDFHTMRSPVKYDRITLQTHNISLQKGQICFNLVSADQQVALYLRFFFLKVLQLSYSTDLLWVFIIFHATVDVSVRNSTTIVILAMYCRLCPPFLIFQLTHFSIKLTSYYDFGTVPTEMEEAHKQQSGKSHSNKVSEGVIQQET